MLMCGHCRTFIGNLRASFEVYNLMPVQNAYRKRVMLLSLVVSHHQVLLSPRQ